MSNNSSKDVLGRSDSLANHIISNSLDLIYKMSLSNRHLEYINSASLEVTGYTPEDYYKEPFLFSKLIHPDSRKYFNDCWADLLMGNAPPFYEYQIIHAKTGKVRWLRQSNILVKDKSGKPIAIEGIVRDVTRQKETEEALFESVKKYSLLAENTADIIWSADLKFNFTYASPAVELVLGYTPEEKIGTCLSSLVDTETFAHVKIIVADLLKLAPESNPILFEIEMLHKDGHTVPVEVKGRMLFDKFGKPIGLQGTTRDITDRKEAEEKLSDIRHRYQGLFDNMTSGVAIYKAVNNGNDFVFVDFNSAGEQIEKVKKEDLIGESVIEMFPEVKQYGLLDVLKRVWETGKPEILPLSFYKDNRVEGWRENKIFRLSSGEVVVVYDDLTVQKQAQVDLRSSNLRLKKYFEQSLVGMAITSVEKGWIEVNDATCSMFGYSEEEFFDLTWSAMTHPDDLEEDLKEFGKILSGEIDNYSIQKRFFRKDGTILFTDLSVNTIRKTDGSIDHFFALINDVTEQKLAEKALLESEVRFKGMFDNMSSGVAIFKSFNNGEDFIFLQLNRAGQKINKVSLEQVKGRHLSEVFPGTLATGLLDVFQDVWQTGKARHNQSVLYKDSRITGWREHFIYKLTTGELVAIFNDVTARRKAELALEENERYYRTLLHSLHEDIIVIGKDYRIVDINNSFVKSSGHRREDVIGRHCFEVTHQEIKPCTQQDEYECKLQEVFNTGNAFSCKHTHIKQDGSSVYMDILLSPLKDADGNVTHVVEAMRDITEMVEAQEELDRLVTAIEQSADTIVITDTKGMIQYANPAFENITGYTIAEAIGQNPRVLQSGKHEIAFYKEMWEKLTEGNTWVGRFINKKKDGTLYTEEATITPVLDASGKIINYVAVKRDITEKLKLETQYRQAQKEESIGRLAGGIAHDLNNLLTPILGYSELLLGDFGVGDPRKDSIDEILQAGLRARDLVRQLLAFSRKQTLEYKSVKINAVVSGLEKLLRRIIREDINISFTLSPEIPDIMADIGQIEQVLMNLTVNASDAMPDGGELGIKTDHVYLDEEFVSSHAKISKGSYILLSITDTGCGIDLETKNHMFEPFYSTKGEQGTGLGLATVYGIIKQHKGCIDVISEPEQGTEFKIYLPVSDKNLDVDQPEEIPLPSLGGSETILLVEDEKSVRELAETLLKQLGYLVFSASNGREALLMVESFADKIDLLLTDVVMPEMNGKELYEEISKKYSSIAALYMSGYTNDVINSHGVLDEDIIFIQKPFSIRELALKVREAFKMIDGGKD